MRGCLYLVNLLLVARPLYLETRLRLRLEDCQKESTRRGKHENYVLVLYGSIDMQ